MESNQYLKEFIDLLGQAKEQYRDYPLKSMVPYIDLVKKYHERIDRASREGEPILAHLVMTPIEIYYAMGITPMFVEWYAIFNTFFRGIQEFLDIAAGFGLPAEVCSAHRVTDAMVLANAFPKPKCWVYSSQACDNTPKSGEGMAEIQGVPYYLLDRPYNYTPENFAYYVEEIKGLIQYLEEQFGRKLDYDRLKEVVMKSYRANQLWMEINNLRKAIPEPLPAEGIFAQTAVMWMLAGTDEAVTFYENLAQEVRERVANKVGAVPNEQFRILFSFLIPFWDMSIMRWMEERHGAVVVMDMLNMWGGDRGDWMIDPDKPIENLAMKTFLHPAGCLLHGPMEPYKEAVVKCAKEYTVDGAIFFSHIGCRQACACIRSIKDVLQEKAGIPSVNIDCDIVDKTFATREEQLEALERFFERLEEAK